MFEAQVAYYLNQYLGQYLHGLDRQALKISVWRGDVQLRNLQLKPEALQNLNLPITVKAGLLGKLTLKVWQTFAFPSAHCCVGMPAACLPAAGGRPCAAGRARMHAPASTDNACQDYGKGRQMVPDQLLAPLLHASCRCGVNAFQQCRGRAAADLSTRYIGLIPMLRGGRAASKALADVAGRSSPLCSARHYACCLSWQPILDHLLQLWAPYFCWTVYRELRTCATRRCAHFRCHGPSWETNRWLWNSTASTSWQLPRWTSRMKRARCGCRKDNDTSRVEEHCLLRFFGVAVQTAAEASRRGRCLM